jgi:hypothetical protein
MKKTVFLILLFFLCAQIASAQDQVVDGDLFVQGGACVGPTCPDSPPGSTFTSNIGPVNLWVNDSAPHIFMRDPDTDAVDFSILVDNDEFGIYNEDSKARLLGITSTGTVQSTFDDSTTVGDGLTVLYEMSVDNQETTLVSDAGFSLENFKENFQWAFRTSETSQGFAATKIGTGGLEFEIRNTTGSFSNASLMMGNGAVCTQGGKWEDASSRDYKENIKDITTTEAMKTLANLKPVKYNLKKESSNDLNVGFIAEDVPELVATKSRKTLSALEIVAVLTKVVQEQQTLVAKLTERINELEKE